MDLDRANSIPGKTNFLIQGNWTPLIPLKPGLQRPQPIYANRYDNQQPGLENWGRLEGSSTGVSRENQGDSGFVETNCFEVNRRGKDAVSCVNAGGNGQACIDPLNGWNNIPFVDLLTQAAMGSAPHGSVLAPSCPFDFGGYYSRIGGSWPETSSSCPPAQNLLVGSQPWTNGTYMPQLTNCELPLTAGRHYYDLNMLPGIMSDELPRSSVPQFAPITPDKIKNQDDQNKNDVTKRVEIIVLDQEETLSQVADSSFPAVSTAITENQSPEKENGQVIDLNMTPQQKPRKKKHRPKVIREGKSKKTQSPAGPKPDNLKENSTVKRKYVRKKGVEKANTTPPPSENVVKSSDPKQGQTAIKSARRALNFDVDVNPESQAAMQKCQLNSIDKAGTTTSEQISSKPDEHLGPISPTDSNCSAIVTLADRQGTAKKRQCDPTLDMDDPRNVNLSGSQYSGLHLYETFKAGDFGERVSGVYFPEICKKSKTEKGQTSTTSSTSSSTTTKNVVNFVRESLQNHSNASILESKGNYCISASQLRTDRVPSTQAEVAQAAMDRVQAFESMLSVGDNERLTNKGPKGPTRVRDLGSLIGNGETQLMQTFPGIQTLFGNEAQGADVSQSPQNCIEVLVTEKSAKLARGKRSQILKTLGSSVSSSISTTKMHQNGIDPWKHLLTIDAITERLKHLNINMKSNVISYQECNALVPYNRKNQSQKARVPNHRKKKSQDALVTYRTNKQEQNALVVYGRDGTLVPFEGPFNPVKKRRPRPKVDLDEETTKVWRLLLENINNEGIDGTDEQKEKWWEEERRVFRGRADSFIARMHLVQGDRRFSKWKGSVVDSVVGVFLTQNVSDHLSSSAFMSMAAHFPLKTNSNGEKCYNYGADIQEEPELCILDQEDTIKWKENLSLNQLCDQNSAALNDPGNNDEKEVVNSHDSFGSDNNNSKSRLGSFGSDLENFHESSTRHLGRGTSCVIGGDRAAMEDVISSQSSVDSSTALIPERRPGQCSESNSESQDPTTLPISTGFVSSTSFVKLLQTAVTPKLDQNHSHKSCLRESEKSLVDACNQQCGYDEQSRNLNRFHGLETSLVESIAPSSNHHSVLTTNSRSQEVDCIEGVEEESRSSEISWKKDESRMSDIHKFTEDSSSKATSQAKLAVGIHEFSVAPRDIVRSNSLFTTIVNETEQTRSKPIGESKQDESMTQGKTENIHQNKLPYFSGEISDVTESTRALKDRKNTEHKGAGPYSKEQNDSSVTVLNETAADTITVKRKRAAKEKVSDTDWDKLRKQAQANGPREKTASTMDSLDWEAVRCADVGEIAHTIRERGMNNMLAERIKAFLNRLVSEHGSLDLEWLRDVPPDKAKEYLLSIRGLGLKSVECIRLLTLHHLAFPVDTNVGRIAVRLGWVPLQPLPESLQLHLLELYPVLESIQKYLWPRLCKLDQRTLYELHYQLITFGKVFCTKSKPNCNACPMRGECRHFASAFASARLALPGPEEKGIVIATENRAAGDNPPIITNTLQLPPPPVDQLSVGNTLQPSPPPVDHHSNGNNKLEVNWPSEAKYGIINNEPIIEEPLTPEPEIVQILECDIEDAQIEDPNEIPMIKLNIEAFTQNLQDYMHKNMELQEVDMSRALVALNPELASLPTPKLKYISRLRTEHQVYELPDSHPLLQGLDKREPDDPCSYLLAIWTPGETIDSIQPPEESCSSQENGKLCAETTCFSCNSIRETNTQTVRGTLLIPCRTAMRGSFPLNGTYFQVNEVFADHDSSLIPIDVPRAWLWNLPRRTVYFGTSIPSIFKGLTTEGIQYCFWRGFVCVRGFDQKSRAPRPLIARLHFPASRLIRTTKAKTDDE